MQRSLLVALACLLVAAAAGPGRLDAQLAPTPEYERLRRYEGIYEAEGGGTLELRASPRDHVLVAVVSGARYPLKAAGEDLFVDATGRRVRMSLEEGQEGYTLLDGGHAGRLFRRLGIAPPLDERVWYPRAPSSPGYKYAPPVARDDGLAVAGVAGTPLDAGRLHEMGDALAAGRHPDVHSVLIAHRDRLVYEEYFDEFGADTPHPLRSATKSIISALVGLAISQNKLSLRQPVLPLFADE